VASYLSSQNLLDLCHFPTERCHTFLHSLLIFNIGETFTNLIISPLTEHSKFRRFHRHIYRTQLNARHNKVLCIREKDGDTYVALLKIGIFGNETCEELVVIVRLK
jgi:hypothetical protein